MKKIGIFIIAMLLPMFVLGQNYSKLWNDVEQAQNKDLPKTALTSVNKIIDLATSKGDNDQLAKALIVKMCLVNEISPDSAEAMLPHVEKVCQSRKSPLDHCVYNALLGWLYKCRTTDRDPQTKNKAIRAFTEASSNPAALATTKTDSYMALLTKGEDSKYYNHDMLSVIFPFVANQLKAIYLPEADRLAATVMGKEIEWYATHHMREATMLAKIDSVDILHNGSRSFYEKLTEEYGDLDVSTQAYAWLCDRYNDKEAYLLGKDVLKRHPNTKYTNEIKNILSKIEQPSLSIYSTANNTYPGDEVKLAYNYKNTKNATLRYYRLPFASSDTAWLNLKTKDYTKYAKKADFTQQLPIRHGEPYDKFRDTVIFTVPDPGIYLVEIGGSDYDNSYSIVKVSRLAVMQLPLPEQKLRISVVDYKNGQPVPYSTVKLRNVYKETVTWQQHVTDGRGELVMPNLKGNTEIFASTEDDKALTPVSMNYSHDYNWNPNDRQVRLRIYTDRAIYRPGQQVKIGGFFYDKDNDTTVVIPDHSLDLEILDVNHRRLQRITVVTDDFGAFSTDFTLPQECLNGMFTIDNNYGSTRFKVEEYKRPKFKVTINKPTDGYVLGDTITVTGQVMTYSGLPLENTTVYCTNERRQTWWFRYHDKEAPLTLRDTVTTDAEGNFSVPVVLSIPKATDDNYWRPLCYSYNISAKATADDGETEEGSMLLTAGNTKTFVIDNIPSVICKEKMPALTITQNNAMGEAVDGEGKYTLVCNRDTLRQGTLQFNKPNQLDFISQLPSGEYKLCVMPTDETNEYRSHLTFFTLLSLSDTKPLGKKPLQVWRGSNEFSYSEPVDVLVATPLKDMWLRYDIMANEQLMESKIIQISDTVMHLRLNWQEKYGRGAHFILALYNEGNLYSESFVLTKPLPDKELQLQWATFRDKLQPGSNERWTLRVLKHDKPVEASLLATMYDASLDKFGKHALPFSLSYNRHVPQMNWSATYNYKYSANLLKGYSRLSEHSFDFTEIDHEILNYNPFNYYGRIMRLGSGLNAGGRVLREVVPLAKSARMNKEVDMMAEVAEMATDDATEEEEEDITGNVEMRSNFNETAYFTSTLRTDANGEATIEFTMPESLTSWNFKALAHTRDVSYGFLDNVIIVQKPLMVQANMPRFLRSGDETSLAVTIRNNSDQPQSGKAQLSITDAQTGQQVKLITEKFAIEPGKTQTIDFPFEVSGDQSMLICRYAALTDEFSDGEQQYLPVISDLQKTVSTVPFMINDGQTHTFPLDSLQYNPNATHSLLTIEYTGNPAWTAISALPSTVNYQTKCSTQLAINYNALTLMRQIIARNPQLSDAIRDWKQQDSVPSFFAQLQKNPELKIVALQNTPWIGDADHERGRLESLMQDDQTLSLKQASMLHKLKEMQTAEGGWQWFPGMPTSTWLTLDIAEMLSNTRALCPDAAEDIDKLLTPAMRFLDSEAAEEVAYIKKYKTKYVPTMWMRYLYARSLYTSNFVNTKATKYLVKHLQKSSRRYDLYDKAMAASILQRAALTKKANLTLKSLMEYTVSRPEMGRYFDSERAPWSWSMYKVPTQVAAINALQLITPDDKQTLNEMRLWLLQSKHTQMWDEPLTATKAISCLLSDGMLAAPTALPSQLDLNLTTREVIPIQEYANIEPFVQAGYVKATFSDSLLAATPQSLTVRQSAATVEQPLSYGAAYLQSWQPAIETPATGSELHLTCQYYLETAGGWQLLNAADRLHKGDRIMVRYDIDADRDFDFVALRDGRPACLEPTSTASGYEWKNGCYRSVEDDGTIWYFDSLSKGRHVIEETYDVDRIGRFTSACPQVQCQYAPEFSARARALTVIVE